MSRYFFFNRKRRNTGYTERDNGTKVSFRALCAEEDGKFTAGKFRTVYKVGKADFEALVAIGAVLTKEWHHTGKSYTKNDFYEWDDEDFLAIYDEHKAEISAMAKEFADAAWMFEQERHVCYVKPYDEYKQAYSYRLITEDENHRKAARHDAISNSDIQDSYERYLLHKQVDEEYHRLALSRIKDEDVRKRYDEEYGINIKCAEENTAFNEILRTKNMATRGKEYYLMQIAQFFYEDEDMYQTVLKACKKAREDEEAAQREAERKAHEKAYKERKAEAEKKQGEYLLKCLKAGKAERFDRVEKAPELSHITLEEMNGKYGWFKAKYEYHLPVYYTGYKFADKRTLNHYIKLGSNGKRQVATE